MRELQVSEASRSPYCVVQRLLLKLCRKAKKGCDKKRPTCGRCARLFQACLPNQDTGTAIAASEEWQASVQKPRMAPLHVIKWRLDAPYHHIDGDTDGDPIGVAAFRHYFYCGDYSIFEDFEQHKLVSVLMVACSMLLKSNQASNDSDINIAIALYAEALAALQAAIRDERQAKEDATLVATILVCVFEVSINRPLKRAVLTCLQETK